MILQVALLLSMLFQLGATIIAISLIRRTRYNVSWILISTGFVLMAIRRLYDFSALFWESQLFSKEDVNSWLGIVISALMFIGVIFIRQIFNLQERIDQLKRESEMHVLSAVIQAEEKARLSFARDLHDGLGPILSSIKMTMSSIETDKLDENNRSIIERSCDATDEAIVSLKEVANHLSPHLLKNYGLFQAIETFANQLLLHSEIEFQITSDFEEERLPYNLEISLYRIITELLTNSIKHAHPNYIRLEITNETPNLHLQYHDDGTGFDPEKTVSEPGFKGMGLENIRSRIKSLHGHLYLSSAPTNGFSINIHIPLQ